MPMLKALATVGDYSAILKGSVPELESLSWREMDLGVFIQRFKGLLLALARKTPMVKKSDFMEAIGQLRMSLTEEDKDDLEHKVSRCFSLALRKRRQATSGSRLPSHIRKLADSLAGHGSRQQPSSKAGPKRVLRRRSTGSSPKMLKRDATATRKPVDPWELYGVKRQDPEVMEIASSSDELGQMSSDSGEKVEEVHGHDHEDEAVQQEHDNGHEDEAGEEEDPESEVTLSDPGTVRVVSGPGSPAASNATKEYEGSLPAVWDVSSQDSTPGAHKLLQPPQPQPPKPKKKPSYESSFPDIRNTTPQTKNKKTLI